MSSITSSLLDGERVVYRARLHWVALLPSLIIGALGLFIFLQPSDSELVAGGALMIGALPFGLTAFLRINTSRFAVTNKRVLIRVGVLRRVSLELLLSKVEGMTVIQSLGGRILGYGTVVISGTGGARDVFSGIERPQDLRLAVDQQIDQRENAATGQL